MLKTLLIDDDEQSRLYLRALLEAHPEVQIVGEADALPAARALLKKNNYDFLFLDIKLGNQTGFDLLPHIPPDKPIVFVTGYSQHASRAFEVNAADYLVKPVPPARLAESLRRVTEHRLFPRRRPPADPAVSRRASANPFASFPPGPEPQTPRSLRATDTVLLNSGDRVEFAHVGEISLIEAAENYSQVHLADGRQILVRRSLKSWADSLPAELFLRMHRTALVNRQHVSGYEATDTRRIALRVTGVAQPILASRDATPALKATLLAPYKPPTPALAPPN